VTPVATGGIDSNPCDANERSFQDSDIRVEYHPSSGRQPQVFGFEGFTRASPANPPPEGPEPWAPFKTRADFEFSALVQEAKMSQAKVNQLINLFHRCIKGGDDSFTLLNYDKMRETLTTASERLPKVHLPIILYGLSISDPHYPSLRKKLFLKTSTRNHIILMFGCAQYGLGLRICYRTQISSNILNGMPAKCQSLMNSQPPGFVSMMSHGQQTDFGKFRYVRVCPICCWCC
jgi:hypothetical protein